MKVEKHFARMELLVPTATLIDLLTTATRESAYWAQFENATEDGKGQLASVECVELDPRTSPAIPKTITVETIAEGIERLSRAAVDGGFQSASKHFSDAISGNFDGTTADVVLQMGIFGEIVYG